MSEPHRCSRMSCSISIGSDAKDVPPAVAPTRLVILGVEAPKLRGYGIGRSFAKERGGPPVDAPTTELDSCKSLAFLSAAPADKFTQSIFRNAPEGCQRGTHAVAHKR
eukprot:scaffold22140_cov67-Phaeocystis_antarctica.AAC.3